MPQPERRRLTVAEAQRIAQLLTEKGVTNYLLHYERGKASLTVHWRGESYIIASNLAWIKYREKFKLHDQPA